MICSGTGRHIRHLLRLISEWPKPAANRGGIGFLQAPFAFLCLWRLPRQSSWLRFGRVMLHTKTPTLGSSYHRRYLRRLKFIKGSDAIGVDVFVNAATGQKIIDYIRIKTNSCDNNNADSPLCLQMANLQLAAEMKQAESSRDAVTVAAIEQSQPLWEQYRDQACSSLSTQSKRLRCEILLTRSRADNLRRIY